MTPIALLLTALAASASAQSQDEAEAQGGMTVKDSPPAIVTAPWLPSRPDRVVPAPPPGPPAPLPVIAEPPRAKAPLQALVSVEDYPMSALARREEGRVEFRLDVGENGRVTGCTITRSSGSSALDATTCRILRSRARYTPARDSNGMPVGYPVEDAVEWRLPGRDGERGYASERVKPGPASWRQVFRDGAVTPLRLSRYKLDTRRTWHSDLVIFVFDPASSLDAIDLWNMRLESRPVLPIPCEWWGELVGDVRKILKSEHRPLQGNPHGVMHHGTVEFARSITEDRAKALMSQIGADMPERSVTIKTWRTPVWRKQPDEDRVVREQRLEITADDRRVELPVTLENRLSTAFANLSPTFAPPYALSNVRWINVVSLTRFRASEVATILPFNPFDPSWPGLRLHSDYMLIGTEGWSLGEQFKDSTTYIPLLSPEEAVIGSLGRLGVEAKLSEPGHIAKQVLNHLGGMWGIYLLKDAETLAMLNNMAGGVRRKGEGESQIEELFDRRSKSVKDWRDLIARRTGRRRFPNITIDDFTQNNIIRLGIKTECTNCHAINWHSLTNADYDLVCERCQKSYRFPQAHLLTQNRNWAYRVVGPFAVPDYGRGAYGALLALNVIESLRMMGTGIDFATALSLEFDGINAEADFVGWWVSEGPTPSPPQLVVGEAKSFGTGELVTRKDISKLMQIARKLSGVTFVISVMRESFTDNEKKLLTSFVNWCRRPNDFDLPTNHVILLTAKELFFDFSVSETWKSSGEPHSRFADYNHTQALGAFAAATQAIYLDLPDYFQLRRERWLSKMRRKGKLPRPVNTELVQGASAEQP